MTVVYEGASQFPGLPVNFRSAHVYGTILPRRVGMSVLYFSLFSNINTLFLNSLEFREDMAIRAVLGLVFASLLERLNLDSYHDLPQDFCKTLEGNTVVMSAYALNRARCQSTVFDVQWARRRGCPRKDGLGGAGST